MIVPITVGDVSSISAIQSSRFRSAPRRRPPRHPRRRARRLMSTPGARMRPAAISPSWCTAPGGIGDDQRHPDCVAARVGGALVPSEVVVPAYQQFPSAAAVWQLFWRSGWSTASEPAGKAPTGQRARTVATGSARPSVAAGAFLLYPKAFCLDPRSRA